MKRQTFLQWLENTKSSDIDQGLRRMAIMPLFNVVGTSISQTGLQQQDPMYYTLHKDKKKPRPDRSPAASMYDGFPKKPNVRRKK